MVEQIAIIPRPNEAILLEYGSIPRIIGGGTTLTIPASDPHAIRRHEAYVRELNEGLRSRLRRAMRDQSVTLSGENLTGLIMNAHAARTISEALTTDAMLERVAQRYLLMHGLYCAYAYTFIDHERFTN